MLIVVFSDLFLPMNFSFEHITALQYRLKAAQTELQSFITGDKYVRMKREQKEMIRFYEQYIKKLKQELAQVRQDIIRIRNQWFEVFEDLETELRIIKEESAKELHAMEERALRAKHQRDEAQAKVTERRHKIYERVSKVSITSTNAWACWLRCAKKEKIYLTEYPKYSG